MGKEQREKGKRFERSVVNDLKDIFGEQVHRGWQSRFGCDAPDVVGTPFWIECKHHKKTNIKLALRQALQDSSDNGGGHKPIAVCKDDNCETIVAMLWEDFLPILKIWQKVTGRDE